MSKGNSIGKESFGTGMTPHELQCIIGIGVPQNLCLDNSQSLSLYCMEPSPEFFSISEFITAFLASSPDNPSNPLIDEFTIKPFPSNADFNISPGSAFSFAIKTLLIGRLYFLAKS